MGKATLEGIVQSLDRLEKMIGHINEQLFWIVEALVPDAPRNCETVPINATNVQKNEQDDNLGRKQLRKYWNGWVIHLILVQALLRKFARVWSRVASDPKANEFSSPIIAERNK